MYPLMLPGRVKDQVVQPLAALLLALLRPSYEQVSMEEAKQSLGHYFDVKGQFASQ